MSNPTDPAESARAAHARSAEAASRTRRQGRGAHATAGDGTRAGRTRASRTSRKGAGFYAGALDAADRQDLADAAAVRGIDQEIAVLRLRLRRLLSDHPEDFALAVRSIELLVRAVGAAGKLSSDDSSEVLDRIYAELGGIVALIADASDGDLPA